VEVRAQKNKMGPFNGKFREWNEKDREGAVTFSNYSERQEIHPCLKIFPSKKSE
jgi:hypothetical protein